MRAAWTFTVLHAFALAVGLLGILVAIPHPGLWAGSARGAAVYAFALTRTGHVSILLGALAMFVYGWSALGPRRTLTFFAFATIVSALAELCGTLTGWPFGGYAYTDFLGWKMFGRVPFAIPFSWFTMGFAAFVLADAIMLHGRRAHRTILSIVLAAWLLMAWDLVLDPAMAAPQMDSIRFWTWHEAGPYFRMPLRNLAGWFGTGLLFIGLGRLAWRERMAPAAPIALPLVIYAVNLGWPIALVLAAGLWPAALIGTLLALAPAVLALRRSNRSAAYA